MAGIVVELHDGSHNPIIFLASPAKTAAPVLDACDRKFNKGVGTLSPKDKPDLLLEAVDTVAGGVTYTFTPSASSQGVYLDAPAQERPCSPATFIRSAWLLRIITYPPAQFEADTVSSQPGSICLLSLSQSDRTCLAVLT